MTVLTSTFVASYTGDGETKRFAYDFLIYEPNHLTVMVDGSPTTVIGIEGLGRPEGGWVTLADAPQEGSEIKIIRSVPCVQLDDFQGGYNPEAIEASFDKVVMMIQQLCQSSGEGDPPPEGCDQFVSVCGGTFTGDVRFEEKILIGEVGESPTLDNSYIYYNDIYDAYAIGFDSKVNGAGRNAIAWGERPDENGKPRTIVKLMGDVHLDYPLGRLVFYKAEDSDPAPMKWSYLRGDPSLGAAGIMYMDSNKKEKAAIVWEETAPEDGSRTHVRLYGLAECDEEPTTDMSIVTKKWALENLGGGGGGYVPITGGTFTGPVGFEDFIIIQQRAGNIEKSYIRMDSTYNAYGIQFDSDDTGTGRTVIAWREDSESGSLRTHVKLFGLAECDEEPTTDMSIVTKKWALENLGGGDGGYVPITGGTFTGPVAFQNNVIIDRPTGNIERSYITMNDSYQTYGIQFDSTATGNGRTAIAWREDSDSGSLRTHVKLFGLVECDEEPTTDMSVVTKKWAEDNLGGSGGGLWSDAGTYIYPQNAGTSVRVNDDGSVNFDNFFKTAGNNPASLLLIGQGSSALVSNYMTAYTQPGTHCTLAVESQANATDASAKVAFYSAANATGGDQTIYGNVANIEVSGVRGGNSLGAAISVNSSVATGGAGGIYGLSIGGYSTGRLDNALMIGMDGGAQWANGITIQSCSNAGLWINTPNAYRSIIVGSTRSSHIHCDSGDLILSDTVAGSYRLQDLVGGSTSNLWTEYNDYVYLTKSYEKIKFFNNGDGYFYGAVQIEGNTGWNIGMHINAPNCQHSLVFGPTTQAHLYAQSGDLLLHDNIAGVCTLSSLKNANITKEDIQDIVREVLIDVLSA